MANAVRLRSILSAVTLYSVLLSSAAHARTLERFNLSAGAGGGLNNPYAWFQDEMGNGFLFLGIGVDLFENRLSLQSDLGVSDKLLARYKYNGWYGDWETSRDTLYEYQTFYEVNEKGFRGFFTYQAVLNFTHWSWYAGNFVLFTSVEDKRSGTHYKSYALGSDLKAGHMLSNEDFSFDYYWGMMNVLPLYGVASRFGRVSIFAQGLGFAAVQAGVRVSLHPLGPVAPHK